MKVVFLVLVYVFYFDLFEFSAAILEKGLLFNGNPSASLGEREMLWEHEPQAIVSKAFKSSPKLTRVFLLNN